MAEFKRRTLILCTGKQIRLYGNSIAIGPSREIGEGAAPNIFSELIAPSSAKSSEESNRKQVQLNDGKEDLSDSTETDGKPKKKKSAIFISDKSSAKVSNPYQLTEEEIHDLADYNIQLWMDLKRNIRKYGVSDSIVFNQDS